MSGSRRHSVRSVYPDHGRRRHPDGDGRQRGFHARDRGSLDRRAALLSLPSAGPMNVVLSGDSQYLVMISSADAEHGRVPDHHAPIRPRTPRPAARKEPSLIRIATPTPSPAIVVSSPSPAAAINRYYNYYNFTLSARRAGERERGQRRFHRDTQPAGCRRQHAGLRFRRRRERCAVQRGVQPARAGPRGQLPPADLERPAFRRQLRAQVRVPGRQSATLRRQRASTLAIS